MNFCKISRNPGTPQINPYLAVTPTQMFTQTMQGKTISQQTLEHFAYFDDGHGAIPMEYRRGVDLNDVWHATKEAKSKVAKFKKDFQTVISD